MPADRGPAPSGIVSLTTDFGLADTYVAQMHATLLRGHPGVRIVDVSHFVAPGHLEGALYLTETAWPHFPPGCVHVVVVDPGVGSDRPLVALATANAYLVGPDTGVLSSGLPPSLRPTEGVRRAATPPGIAAVEITRSRYAAPAVSRTFQGRDVMAPVAAALARGAQLESVGTPLDRVAVAGPIAAPVVAGRGEGRIIHVDHFGNAITNVRAEDAGEAFTLTVMGRGIAGPLPNYQAAIDAQGAPQPAVVPGSAGYLEIAWTNSSAAERLGLRVGDAVLLRPR